MPNYRLTVEYVGTRFAGWQIQPGLRTVQGELRALLRRLFDQDDLLVAGAARTDAGVHARGQVATLQSDKVWDPDRLGRALNRLLPEDIAVAEAAIAEDGFHARRSARGRIYRYQIATGDHLSPFLAPYAHHHRSALDVAAMAAGAAHLLGEHDFSSFRAAGDLSTSTVKTIRRSEVAQERSVIAYTVEGNSFLQHMVRAIVGTLIEVGRGHRPPEWLAEVLRARDRAAAGPTAPARGLFLEKVLYIPG